MYLQQKLVSDHFCSSAERGFLSLQGEKRCLTVGTYASHGTLCLYLPTVNMMHIPLCLNLRYSQCKCKSSIITFGTVTTSAFRFSFFSWPLFPLLEPIPGSYRQVTPLDESPGPGSCWRGATSTPSNFSLLTGLKSTNPPLLRPVPHRRSSSGNHKKCQRPLKTRLKQQKSWIA